MEELLQKIREYETEINTFSGQGAEAAEAFRIRYLGTKGLVKQVMGEMKQVPNDRKKEFGQVLNDFKQLTERKWEELKNAVAENGHLPSAGEIDLSLPGDPLPAGQAVRIPVQLPMQLGNHGGLITLLDAQGLKVDGVSYAGADSAQEGWTVVF